MQATKYWYWSKWIAILTIKSIFELAFIYCCLVAPILEWIGMINISYTVDGYTLAITQLVGGIFSLAAIGDWIATLVVPWEGGNWDSPFLMENYLSWQEYKDKLDNPFPLFSS